MHVSPSTYLEALFLVLGDSSDKTKALVREFLTVSEKEGQGRDLITGEDELIPVYRYLIKTVVAEGITQDDTTAAKMLLLKIKSTEALKNHPVIRDVLTDVLTATNPVSAIQVGEYTRKLRNVLLQATIDDTAKKVFARSRRVSEVADAFEQESELVQIKNMLSDGLKSIEDKQNTSDAKASETYVSISDRDSMLRSINNYMTRNVTAVLKSGLQGINKALGARGGIGLGESWVFAAPSHHFKSGILLKWFKWLVEYNNVEVPPGRKAMIYFVSVENEVMENLWNLFKDLYMQEHKKAIEAKDFTSEFVVDWIQSYFGKFNMEMYIDRYTPHDFTYGKFIQRSNAFREQGYDIIAFVMDYLSEVKGIDPGDTYSALGRIQMIQENYQKFHNNAKQMGYAFLTGHQLTKKAEEKAATHPDPVRIFDPSMMADSSDVFRIVDGLFYMYLKINFGGVKFLTMQNRKNRGNQDTPDSHKYCAYPFTQIGIVDDIGGVPGYTTDINSYDGPEVVAGPQQAFDALL